MRRKSITGEAYVVIARRWGERDSHSYPIGIFAKKHKAIKSAEQHADYRGGKYACIVYEATVDKLYGDLGNNLPEVYRAKSMKN